MRVFIFPGQGSQKKGMGAELFDSVTEFAAVEEQANELLGYSLRELCLEDADEKLGQTQFTQPCLFVVNALHYYQAIAEGRQPDAAAGHSFGEYNALLAAGVFDFLTGLRLVQKRGQLMSRATNGAMTAVIGLEPEKIAETIEAEGLDGIDVANYNSPVQTVISGIPEHIERATVALNGAGARVCIPLKVSGAFHSRYMRDAAEEFDQYLQPFEFNAPKIPVIANVTAQPYPEASSSAAIRDLLVRQLFNSVLWTDSIRYLINAGATEFEELGPGKALTKLLKQING